MTRRCIQTMIIFARAHLAPAVSCAVTAVALAAGPASVGCGGEGAKPQPNQTGEPAMADATVPRGRPPTHVVFLHARPGSNNAHLYMARQDGTRLRRIDSSDEEKQDPEVSPDGRRIAYRSLARGDYSDTPLLVLDIDSGRTTSLTQRSGVRGFGPTWSPDGQMLAVAGKRREGDTERLWLMRPDGSGARPVPLPDFEAQYPAWSPDGSSIAFTAVEEGGFAIYVVAPDGTNLRRLTERGGSANTPSWSPDGGRIAYGDGDAGIFVMNRDGSAKRLVTRAGGAPISWSPGQLILYGCTGKRGQFATCGVDPGRGETRELLGGLEAGFAAWVPRRDR